MASFALFTRNYFLQYVGYIQNHVVKQRLNSITSQN